MTPDDPRHGTVAGYNRIPCREQCCRLAMANYKKRWAWDQHNARPRIVSTLGTKRRIQALNRLGWSNERIAQRAGMKATNMTRLLYGETMTARLAAKFADVYEVLSMQLPTGNKQAISTVRNRAERMGWPPPLAWDDIDNDPEPQGMRRANGKRADLDENVVTRVLAGEWRMHTTPAEKAEIARRWVARGGSAAQLSALTGWKVERYFQVGQEGAA